MSHLSVFPEHDRALFNLHCINSAWYCQPNRINIQPVYALRCYVSTKAAVRCVLPCNLKLPASMLTLAIWALFAVKIEDSGREYKTYRGLRADLEPPELKNRPGRSIHLFLGSNNWTSLSGHLNPDGSYAGTLAMKNGGQHFKSSTNLHFLFLGLIRGVNRQ